MDGKEDEHSGGINVASRFTKMMAARHYSSNTGYIHDINITDEGSSSDSEELEPVVNSERLRAYKAKMSTDVREKDYDDTQYRSAQENTQARKTRRHTKEQDNTQTKSVQQHTKKCTRRTLHFISESEDESDTHTKHDVSNTTENKDSTLSSSQSHSTSGAQHIDEPYFNLTEIPLSDPAATSSMTDVERTSAARIGGLDTIETERTIVTQPQSVQHTHTTENDSCIRICAHNCYICCCPCCYRRVVNSKIKSEYSHLYCEEQVSCWGRVYRKCCICYEFSRKCPGVYITYLSCVNYARACKAQTSEHMTELCHEGMCRNMCLFCKERKDRVTFDVMTVVPNRVLKDIIYAKRIAISRPQYEFKHFSSISTSRDIFKNGDSVDVHFACFSEIEAVHLLGYHITRRLYPIASNDLQLLKIVFANANDYHIVRAICGDITYMVATNISDHLNALPRLYFPQTFIVGDLKGFAALGKEMSQVYAINDKSMQAYVHEFMSLYLPLINVTYVNEHKLKLSATGNVGTTRSVAELMSHISHKRHLFLHCDIAPQTIQSEDNLSFTFDRITTLKDILLRHNVRHIPSLTPMIVRGAFSGNSNNCSTITYSTSNPNGLCFDHKPNDIYIHFLYEIKLYGPLHYSDFKDTYNIHVIFPFVGSEHCIIVNEYNLKRIKVESRLKVPCAFDAKIISMHELKHPIFMLLSANSAAMQCFLDAIKYVIIDGDISLSITRIMEYVNGSCLSFNDFHYTADTLINMRDVSVFSSTMQAIFNLVADNVTYNNFDGNYCIVATKMLHIEKCTVSYFDGTKKKYVSLCKIRDILKQHGYHVLSAYSCL